MIFEGICIGGSIEGQKRVHISPSFYTVILSEEFGDRDIEARVV